VFAENQDYGIHGERVRTACWGYLCQSGGMELKEVMRQIEVLACWSCACSGFLLYVYYECED